LNLSGFGYIVIIVIIKDELYLNTAEENIGRENNAS